MGAVLRRGLTADADPAQQRGVSRPASGLGEYRFYGTPGGEGTITFGGYQLQVEVPSGR